jgi:hypothetical protein
MVTKIETFAVVTTGIGNPDYSQTIDKIKRGETYSQFEPRTNEEKYKIFVLPMLPNVPFGPFTPLQIGETRHYMDVETFLPSPYTAPAGMTSDFREWFFSCDGRVALSVFMDGITSFYMPVERYANVHQYEQIVWGKTSIMDPNALLPHIWDFTITNLEAAQVVTGTVHVSLVLRLA